MGEILSLLHPAETSSIPELRQLEEFGPGVS